MNDALPAILDGVLGLLTIGIAAAALWTHDRARMIMLFIALGLVIGLIWVRLNAPDVALAEVAIGAALTGGLMLRIYSFLGPAEAPPPRTRGRAVAALLLAGLVFVPLALALQSLQWPIARPIASEIVFQRLAESGVSNPVTAVLLNFRAYDTLLEVGVLLIAVVGVWVLNAQARPLPRIRGDMLFDAMVRLVVPLLCMLSAYLLWLGSFAPGGAFQAGTVLAAALTLLLLSPADRLPGREDHTSLRVLLVTGLLVFIGVAAATAISSSVLLQYPQAYAKWLILLIEGALTGSIALTLLMLLVGGRPRGERDGA